MRGLVVMFVVLAAACAESEKIVLPPIPREDAPDLSKDPCAGADVDLNALFASGKAPCVGAGWPAVAGEHGGDASMLAVKVTPERAAVAPGGRVDFIVTLTNRGSGPVTLWFFGDLTLAPYVFDAKGARVAPPEGSAPHLCRRDDDMFPNARVTLPAGGRAHGTASWVASRLTWPEAEAAADCATNVEAVAGAPIEAGHYAVVVPIPFFRNDAASPPPRAVASVDVGP